MDVKRLLEMAVLWKDRTPPTPLEFDSFSKDSTASIKAPKSSIDYDFKAWKIQQCVVEFTSSIDAISKQFISCKKGDVLIN